MVDGKWKCPKCGTENDAENAFCGECGSKKPERETRIAAAGRVIPKETKPEPAPVQDMAGEKPKSKKGVIIAFIVVFVTGIIIAVVLGGSSDQPSNSGYVPPARSEQPSNSGYVQPAQSPDRQEAERRADEAKADAERKRAAAEAERREAERQKAEAERQKAEAERQKAEAERQKAEAAARAKLQQWEKNHLWTSGLYWIDGGTKTWAAARNYCSSFTDRETGFSGWRLPTVDELRRLNGKKRDRYWNSSSYSFWDNRDEKVGTDTDARHKVEYMFYCVRNK